LFLTTLQPLTLPEVKGEPQGEPFTC